MGARCLHERSSILGKLWGKVLLEDQFLQAMYFTAEGIYCNSYTAPVTSRILVFFVRHYLLKGKSPLI